MYVANSEPTEWLRGGGRAGVRERVLITGEPKRGEVGRDVGRRCDLTRGNPPDLTPKFLGGVIKRTREGRDPDWERPSKRNAEHEGSTGHQRDVPEVRSDPVRAKGDSCTRQSSWGDSHGAKVVNHYTNRAVEFSFTY